MSGKPFQATETDRRIGRAIQVLRAKEGLSQKNLAEMLGVTFQQVQKYETAGNRISASRLYDIAQALDVPVGALYNEHVVGATIHDKEMSDLIRRIYKLDVNDKKLLKQFIYRLGKKTL